MKIDLGRHLWSAHEQSRRGAASFTFDPELANQLAAKSTALLAFAIAASVAAQGHGIPARAELMATLPRDVAAQVSAEDPGGLHAARELIERAPLASFGLATSVRLRDYAEAIGVALSEPLLVLFDRGDLVVGPVLAPVFSLLDQSDAYTAVAAMRPGVPPHSMPFLLQTGVIAGDQYPVVHVGQYPRSPEWRAFVAASLANQPDEFRRHFEQLPDELFELVLDMTRDSIRWTVDVVWRFGLFLPGRSPAEAVTDALIHCRDKMQRSARASLKELNNDVGALIAGLRREAFGIDEPPRAPLVVDIATSAQQELTPTPSDVDVFVALGLRHGVFAMPHGEPWYPGDTPRELEIHPLLLSLAKGPFARITADSRTRVRRTPSQLKSGGQAQQKPAIVFVAVEMDDPRSRRLAPLLQSELDKYEIGRGFDVQVGESGPGDWAEGVRQKIADARVVVGDVTRMRPDILTELGYGYSLGKDVIPVVEERQQVDAVPQWLRRLNVSWFGDPEGVQHTAAWCARAVTRGGRRKRRPSVPTKVLWLRELEWASDAQERFRASANQDGLAFDAVSLGEDRGESPTNQGELLESVSAAGLLVGLIDGRAGDQLVHFAAGMVVARPRAKGAAPARQVILVVRPDLRDSGRRAVAESLAFTPVVKVLWADDGRATQEAMNRYFSSIRGWKRSMTPPGVLDGP